MPMPKIPLPRQTFRKEAKAVKTRHDNSMLRIREKYRKTAETIAYERELKRIRKRLANTIATTAVHHLMMDNRNHNPVLCTTYAAMQTIERRMYSSTKIENITNAIEEISRLNKAYFESTPFRYPWEN